MKFNIHFEEKDNNSANSVKKSRINYLKLILSGIFVILISYIVYVSPQQSTTSQEFNVGDIIQKDIVVQKDLTIEDKKSTGEKIQQAQENVIPVYEYYPDIKADTVTKINNWFELLRQYRQKLYQTRRGNQTVVQEAREEIQSQFGIEVDPQELNGLLRSKDLFTALDINRLVEFIRSFYNKGLLLSKSGTPKSIENLIRVNLPDGQKKILNVANMKDFQDIAPQLKNHLESQGLSAESQKLLTDILSRFFVVNYSYSQSLTNREKQNVAEKTVPVILKFKRGKVILRKGDEVKEEDLKILNLITSAEKMERKFPRFYLILIIMSLLFYSLDKIFLKWPSPDLNRGKLRTVTGVTLLLGAFLYRISLFLFPLILKNLSFELAYNMQSIYFAIPFGATALITAFIFNIQSAVIISFVNSIIGAIVCNWELPVLFYILLGNLMVCFSIESYNRLRRSTIFKAGFFVLLPVNLLVILFMVITQKPFDLQLLFTDLSMGLFSVLFSTLIASFIIPAWEIIFKLITDLKLSELSNLNSSIFRELLEKAPGTYHHSQMVASLSESVSHKLNLSTPLLTAMALYHDIGKIDNPQFFTENHTIYQNPHLKLPPHESSKHITSHIADGVEKAKKLKLPDLMIDAIREHHGTKIVKYFHDQYLALPSGERDQFHEQQFRYPGPKPRSIETAIIMLADQVEAATRSLESYSTEKVKTVIEDIITSNINEGQFDQCRGLTFQSLNTIANSFLRKLSSIYHRRISYPGFEFEDNRKDDQADQ